MRLEFCLPQLFVALQTKSSISCSIDRRLRDADRKTDFSSLSDFHTTCLKRTIESQKNEFARLNQIIENKSQPCCWKSKRRLKQPGQSSKVRYLICERLRYSNRYDGIPEQAECAVRGSPVKRALYLCAPTLYRRFCNNKTEVLNFMTDFRVPFDNNGSARDLRMLKLQQKVSGCFCSAAGAVEFCRVHSYLSSHKQGCVLLSALESALSSQPFALKL